jgi:hypothetical protein
MVRKVTSKAAQPMPPVALKKEAKFIMRVGQEILAEGAHFVADRDRARRRLKDHDFQKTGKESKKLANVRKTRLR